jgi:hypothetical protein
MKYLNNRIFHRHYGTNDYGFSDVPVKISGIKISREIVNVEEGPICTRCFPHGFEMRNSNCYNMQRSWKTHRKNKFKKDLKNEYIKN